VKNEKGPRGCEDSRGERAGPGECDKRQPYRGYSSGCRRVGARPLVPSFQNCFSMRAASGALLLLCVDMGATVLILR
jgi:hypothetical protein